MAEQAPVQQLFPDVSPEMEAVLRRLIAKRISTAIRKVYEEMAVKPHERAIILDEAYSTVNLWNAAFPIEPGTVNQT